MSINRLIVVDLGVSEGHSCILDKNTTTSKISCGIRVNSAILKLDR
eukprot:CAMPEP_0181227624 /NCGR_PEP_ID=MMETSP1096-20121128/32890_1 /TAXON_ID=156174 ORGANISM="Chrysochromulina ericina, Strain CCMP281" /NCGR_SAMPLE_ID=MMETSP1096 /ASSEMBLY_ACC=CAM_ASM_000453 /LENGTH=45 /DNA_ID= /DNA_START= /DNA_END= /DNA_ORIENTATION=